MSVLSPQDIVDLRNAVEELFPDTADIYHRTNAGSGTYGGSQPTYPGVPDIADVPVLFVQRNVAEIDQAGLSEAIVDQILTFPGGTDVRQNDRVIVDTLTYEVVNVGGGGSWEVTKDVVVRRVL